MSKRPDFKKIWSQFKIVYGSGNIVDVGNRIGGKVKVNIDLGLRDSKLGFTNACAIRMSYALNYSGIIITRGEWKTVSGGNGNWYIYRVKDLIKYLTDKFGSPDKVVKSPKYQDFTNDKGIMVFSVDWSDATGHATLWNGKTCSDNCYFPIAKEAYLWSLE